MKHLTCLYLTLLFACLSEARILQSLSITNQLGNGRAILLEVERNDAVDAWMKEQEELDITEVASHLPPDMREAFLKMDKGDPIRPEFVDEFRVSVKTPEGGLRILKTVRSPGIPLIPLKKAPLDTPFLIKPIDFVEMRNGGFCFFYKRSFDVAPWISPRVFLSTWEPTADGEFHEKNEQTLYSTSHVYGGQFCTINEALYAVFCYVGRGSEKFDFWRIGESEAIREKYSPIPVPAEWQSMTNRVISVSTNHLSGGYSFVAKAERNYRCKRIYSWGRNENESGLENRTQTNTNDSFATGYPIVTGTDRYTWTILGLDDRTIETSADERLYYSAQGLFWPHADTEPDRILDVYRNDKGVIYLANERFDGFTVWTYKHEWDLLNVETVFGPSFRKPVAGATFHPIGESLYLQIDFENGTTDYWKIDGQDAEKLQAPPLGLKKQTSKREDAG